MLCLSLFGSTTLRADTPKFEFRDGDRVVFLGGTFVEREGQFGYLETAFTSSVPNVRVTFRNLGASGDTVWSDARGVFDPPAAGTRRLLELVRAIQPTVVFLAYGAQESLAGEAGLKPFVRQYEQLLDALDAASLETIAPDEYRYVFFTPHQFEAPKPPLKDLRGQNAVLGQYAQAIRELAARRGGWVIDLYDRAAPIVGSAPAATGPEPPRGFHAADGVWKSLPLTENGVQLSRYGYVRAARIALQALKLPHAEFLLQLDSEGEVDAETQTHAGEFHSDGKQARFQMKLSRLPEPPTPLYPKDVEYFVVAGGGLPSGKYDLKIDGVVAAANPTLLVGFPIRAGADYEQAERLRKRIVAKNQFFADRWRPRGLVPWSELLRLEPAPSAAEAARPDPQLERAEAEIAELKQPVSRQYEIVPRAEEPQP